LPLPPYFVKKATITAYIAGNKIGKRLDILPSLSQTLGPKGPRKGIPTVFSPQGLTHFGGFLLLAT